jgi:hypothetical protein
MPRVLHRCGVLRVVGIAQQHFAAAVDGGGDRAHLHLRQLDLLRRASGWPASAASWASFAAAARAEVTICGYSRLGPCGPGPWMITMRRFMAADDQARR